MGFSRGEIRIKATNISAVDRKGGKSIFWCRVLSGAITAKICLDIIKDLNTLGVHTTLMGERIVVLKQSHLAAGRKDRSSSLPSSL